MKTKENRKTTIIPIILIIVLFIAVIGFTYAIFTYSKEGRVRNIVTTGNIAFTYTETTNGISLENALPMDDEVGKKLEKDDTNNGYFDFNVSCTMAGFSNILYEVYSTKETVDDELDEEYVKVYLTDATTDEPLVGYDKTIPTYDQLKKSIKDDKAKQLYYGNFTSSGTQKFRLRMWVSKEYTLASESKHFKIKVNVEANS